MLSDRSCPPLREYVMFDRAHPQKVYDGVFSFICLFSSSSLSSLLHHFYFSLLPKPFIHKHHDTWPVVFLPIDHEPVLGCCNSNIIVSPSASESLSSDRNNLSFFSFLIVNIWCYSFIHQFTSSRYVSVVSLSFFQFTINRL